MTNPEGRAVSDGNRMAIAVGQSLSSVGEKRCPRSNRNDTECNTHLTQQDVAPGHAPRTKVGSLLERRVRWFVPPPGYAGRGEKKKRGQKKKSSVLLCAVAEH